MPIHINLLAESQGLEELRRRDPVKRAIWVSAALVIGVLAWSSSLYVKAMIANGEFARLEGQINSRTNEYSGVLENSRKLQDATDKLGKLRLLSTSRFLNGTFLNALQLTTLDDVQLVRLKTDMSYVVTEETKPKTNGTRVVLGKPASVVEKIVLTLDARDVGPNPGDQVNRFKQAIADAAYFQQMLGKTNEVRLSNPSPPQPDLTGRNYVAFTLEARLPEKTR